MAATVTKIATPAPIGNGMKIGVFSVALDNSYPSGGEAIDLTDYFDYVYSVSIGGNDTLADNQYKFDALLPGATTALTSSNLLITAYWDPADAGAAEAFDEVTAATDLSAVGALAITVIGK